jgi:hypothetical protein
MANTTSLHFDPNVPGTRLWHLALDELEGCPRLGNLRRFHLSDYDSHRCHKFSPDLEG